jgi:tripartite-type tricarboxylate transporter receptor subunit TctC
LAAGAAVLPLAGRRAKAQAYPSRPIMMVVPYAAGGPVDVVGRILAARMSELLGREVVVENIVGAGGMTGMVHTARAMPDGYQFVIAGTGAFAQNQTLYKHALYNAASDFAPLGLVAEAPAILVVRKEFPAANLQEFATFIKAHPDKVQFGSSGAGSGQHISCVLLNSRIGASVTHVPYRGVGPAYADLIAGRIDYMCDFVATALPQIEANTVKPLATLTIERTPVLPDLPTADEAGLAHFDAPGWYALALPKGTPDTIVNRLNKAMTDALDSPGVADRLKELGTIPVRGERRTPEYLAKFIPSEIEKWAAAIKASGLSMD